MPPSFSACPRERPSNRRRPPPTTTHHADEKPPPRVIPTTTDPYQCLIHTLPLHAAHTFQPPQPTTARSGPHASKDSRSGITASLDPKNCRLHGSEIAPPILHVATSIFVFSCMASGCVHFMASPGTGA
ncbi:hypothetical protein D1007_44406 [Hordeum vulgare]|nr:hypothetical protein D1007_44406 [Hordeum vulgare]